MPKVWPNLLLQHKAPLVARTQCAERASTLAARVEKKSRASARRKVGITIGAPSERTAK